MTFDIKQLQMIVREAGKILKESRAADGGVEQKQGEANFVTEYDVKIQQFLVEKLGAMIPDATFFGEEDTEGNQAGRLSEGFTFIIDPIDGTTNFLFDCQYSCISVAVAWGGALVAGCIYNPYLNNMYLAVRGLGCYLNGRKLKIEDLPLERLQNLNLWNKQSDNAQGHQVFRECRAEEGSFLPYRELLPIRL